MAEDTPQEPRPIAADDHKQPLPPHPRSHSEAETVAGSPPSHGISFNFPESGGGLHGHSSRPQPIRNMSAPSLHSPARHHKRTPSKSRGVKETLNARSHYGSSDDDGSAVHRINQYIIKQEIGRGSFGAVHLAVDQFGNEFAVKEFSKSRLRKRAQSNLLRKPNQSRRPGHLAAGQGFNSPLHRLSSSDKLARETQSDSLALIKEEIAIMKKLNHTNLACLIEVLDDPQEDSLYMVLEMCKKGVVMKVGLDERADPYEEEACRCWFRDMILGMEYLHAQGIIHRDIKPDNCLITSDDVLKIVDFGVSEMFEKQSDMATAKSAGSPAFMPPELCVARHGQVSGKAADIWSMGATLYCLRYGHIPFEKTGMLELYDSIRNDELALDEESNKTFEDLMRRMLDKNPETRITMDQLREHPWVTKDGEDALLSAEENCADLVDPPTEAEMDCAITGNMAQLLIVMKAVKRFKRLLSSRRGRLSEGIFGGKGSKLVAPPSSIRDGEGGKEKEKRPISKILVTAAGHDKKGKGEEGDDEEQPKAINEKKTDAQPETHAKPGAAIEDTEARKKQREESLTHHTASQSQVNDHNRDNDNNKPSRSHERPTHDHDTAKGHAHDPLMDTLYLHIGPSASDDGHGDGDGDGDGEFVSESPDAVEGNFYERAYQDEVKRILDKAKESGEGEETGELFMNRRVEEHHRKAKGGGSGGGGGKLAGLLRGSGGSSGGGGFASISKRAVDAADKKAQPSQQQHDEEKEKERDAEDEDDPPLKAPPGFDGGADSHQKDEATTTVEATSESKEEARHDEHQDDDDVISNLTVPGEFPVTPGV